MDRTHAPISEIGYAFVGFRGSNACPYFNSILGATQAPSSMLCRKYNLSGDGKARISNEEDSQFSLYFDYLNFY